MFKKYIYRNGILYGPGPINEKNFDKLHNLAKEILEKEPKFTSEDTHNLASKDFANKFNDFEHSLDIKHEHGYSYTELF